MTNEHPVPAWVTRFKQAVEQHPDHVQRIMSDVSREHGLRGDAVNVKWAIDLAHQLEQLYKMGGKPVFFHQHSDTDEWKVKFTVAGDHGVGCEGFNEALEFAVLALDVANNPEFVPVLFCRPGTSELLQHHYSEGAKAVFRRARAQGEAEGRPS